MVVLAFTSPVFSGNSVKILTSIYNAMTTFALLEFLAENILTWRGLLWISNTNSLFIGVKTNFLAKVDIEVQGSFKAD